MFQFVYRSLTQAADFKSFRDEMVGSDWGTFPGSWFGSEPGGYCELNSSSVHVLASFTHRSRHPPRDLCLSLCLCAPCIQYTWSILCACCACRVCAVCVCCISDDKLNSDRSTCNATMGCSKSQDWLPTNVSVWHKHMVRKKAFSRALLC